jgi:hypothetical protein
MIFDESYFQSPPLWRRYEFLVPVISDEKIQESRMAFHVVDWLPPDFGAVGQHAVIHARALAEQGAKVCLVGLSSRVTVPTRETSLHSSLLEFKRLPAKRYDKQDAVRRLFWSLRTNARLILEVIRDRRSRDADLLFTGSPPFMLFFAFFAKWTRGMRLIYRITDFYPEVLIAAYGKTTALSLLQRLTWFFRHRVDEFQVLGEDQRRILEGHGIRPDRITLLRDIPPFAMSGKETAAQRPAALDGYKILLYSGNYGVAHEINTVIQGLKYHHQKGKARFGLWLNASGSAVSEISGALKDARIPFALTAPVNVNDLAGVLLAADALLISLRSEFSGYVMPSKVYGCIASGKPIVFVGPETSDVHLLCQQAGDVNYEHITPGDVEGFSAALDRLASMSAERPGRLA